jgi:thioredoxin 1
MSITLTRANKAQEINNSFKKPLIIDAHAEWCGPCQAMKPVFAELETELSAQYTFADIDVDEEPELATEYGIRSVPTFIFVKNGKTVGIKSGSMSKQALKKLIEESFK